MRTREKNGPTVPAGQMLNDYADLLDLLAQHFSLERLRMRHRGFTVEDIRAEAGRFVNPPNCPRCAATMRVDSSAKPMQGGHLVWQCDRCPTSVETKRYDCGAEAVRIGPLPDTCPEQHDSSKRVYRVLHGEGGRADRGERTNDTGGRAIAESDHDIPDDIRRELMRCATAVKVISYYYLCDLWRRGYRAGAEAIATPPRASTDHASLSSMPDERCAEHKDTVLQPMCSKCIDTDEPVETLSPAQSLAISAFHAQMVTETASASHATTVDALARLAEKWEDCRKELEYINPEDGA